MRRTCEILAHKLDSGHPDSKFESLHNIEHFHTHAHTLNYLQSIIVTQGPGWPSAPLRGLLTPGVG